ncbi:HupE/UreJ family protein [Granulosicoccaceae sp. 1_MG-2023]|nr:HupE/UreJ family protein [Granulosicoccaceae sp. 1_MG-2023]
MTRLRLVLWAGLLAAPLPVSAHSSVAGIGHFYNGFLHPLFVPAHLMLLLALSLCLGQQNNRLAEAGFAFYTAGLAAGLLLAGFALVPGEPTALLLLAMLSGLLVALGRPLARPLCLALAVAAGLALGLDSVHESLSGNDKWMFLCGCGLGVLFFSLYPLLLADKAKAALWMKTGVRVAGSWIAAAALLVLALAYAGTAGQLSGMPAVAPESRLTPPFQTGLALA